MPFLSVIIPVYKVEEYLHQCVDSVLKQELDDYELLLVDDGSPDTCPQICDEYAEQFQQIRVIHKPNGGLSSARNAGIREATGQYIMFMDSDDWWNPDVCVKDLLKAVRAHSDVDMFLFSGLDYIEGEGYFERSDSINRLTARQYNAEEYYRSLLALGNLQVHAATKILRTAFLIEHDLGFTCGITGEDNEWMLRLLRSKPAIMVIQEPLYIYRAERAGSITNTIKAKNVEDLLKVVGFSIKFYSDNSFEYSLKDYEFCFCAYLWFCALGLSRALSRDEIAALKPRFKETATVCKYSNSRKTKLAYTAYRSLGYEATAFILGEYIHLKSKMRFNKKKVS